MAPDLPPEHKPHEPFTVTGWLVSIATTTIIIGIVIGVLFMVFVGDKYWGRQDDPAAERQEIAQMDARMKALEDKLNNEQKSDDAGDVSELRNDLNRTNEQTAALQEKIEQIDSTKEQDNNTNRLLLGIAQLKTAYDEDLPLQPGIETLSSAVDNPDLRSILAQLKDLAAQGVPSKESLLRDVNALSQPAPQPSLNQSGLTWQQRAKLALGQFVRVKTADQVALQSNLHNLKQAIVVNDLATANLLLQQMPNSPAAQILLKKIQIRLKTQQLMHDAISSVTRVASIVKKTDPNATAQGDGALY